MNADFWDEKFADETYRYSTEPNAFLVDASERYLEAGAHVLCVGDGEGRNGVWLAEQGYQVHILEPSGRGLAKARALADERGVTITTTQGRFPEDAPDVRFDAVVLVYVHVPAIDRPGFHAAAAEQLAPDGVVILEGFDVLQRDNMRTSGGPQKRDMLFTTGTLAADFEAADLLELEATTTRLTEGHGHDGEADVVRMVARRRLEGRHADALSEHE